MKTSIPFLLVLFLTSSCSLRVRTQLQDGVNLQPITVSTPVAILNLEQDIPKSAEKIGTTKITDGGMTMDCRWETVLERVTKAARVIGGNLVKITKHTSPGILSSCHQIEADIYLINSEEVLLKDLTASSKKGFNSVNETPTTPPPRKIDFQKYRIATNGGWSYLMAKTNQNVPSDFKQYISELKSGMHFSADAGYFWRQHIGLGLKYSDFYTSNSLENIYITDNNTGQTRYGRMSDNIHNRLIAPMLYMRGYSKNEKIVWFANIALGYMTYKNENTAIDRYIIKGGTFGSCLDLGADLKLSKNFYFGLGLGYTAGALQKLKVDDGNSNRTVKLDKDNYESMNRFDVSGGFRLAW